MLLQPNFESEQHRGIEKGTFGRTQDYKPARDILWDQSAAVTSLRQSKAYRVRSDWEWWEARSTAPRSGNFPSLASSGSAP
ncbi:hypothetical protein RBWH47_05263 [Rhodopirellula baltica WH47]|uniref:Uncharacterized protein n=2 Tax=Rhodopirellula baltica TaxID=265606 RepID=F2AW22_RHOBT|nr:hypothetical protein RBWH47_05263 [Rhodopirellula baltica WH47]ELP29784.1 hypothetical protein RBSWK_06312 [Rhodopirellula baltica SWK14]